MRPIFRLAGLTALLVASTARAQSAPSVVGEGFEVERYAVSLRPDLRTTAISGMETVVVRATADAVSRIVFTANALSIRDATADGAPVEVSSDADGVAFVLPQPLNAGAETTLSFRLEGTPARGVTATPAGLYTSYFACDWMVCLQDAPGDKAELTLDLFLPEGAASAGTGLPEPMVAATDGLVRHRWRTTRPYSPYLYGFAAGDLPRETVPAPEGELVFLDATGKGADLAERFAATAGIAAFFADKAGLPLPDRRYAQVLVPDREAQEAAGFALIGAGELDREAADPSSAWIIAHEMAHQWWGNLVTCATWRDFWLNEGIATFMTAAWKQHSLGEAAYRQELEVARGRVERVRALGFDKPLAWDGRYPSLGARRAVQYSKGALFLAHLRETIGDDAFWAGLRDFTRTHAGGAVTSRDFQTAMETAGGRDLSALFTEWVYGAETPFNPAS